jgi:hypothetical protein
MPAPAVVTRLTVSMLSEERLVADTCALVKSDGSKTGPEDPWAGAASDVQQALRKEAQNELNAMFRALDVGAKCQVDASLKVGVSADCKVALEASTGKLMEAIRREGGRAESLIEHPFEWARRLDVGGPLVLVGVRIADGSEDAMKRLASTSPYLDSVVQAFLLEVAGEIVAIGFEEALQLLAREHAVGPASIARAACDQLSKKQGPVATRLLRRAVLRFERRQWADALREDAGKATTRLEWQGIAPERSTPLTRGCEEVAKLGDKWSCKALWDQAHAQLAAAPPWSPQRLVPELWKAPPRADVVDVLSERLRRSATLCDACTASEVGRLASLSIAFGAPSPGQSGKDWLHQMEPKLTGDSLALDALRAELIEHLTRLDQGEVRIERREEELDRKLERIARCSEENRKARSDRIEALKKQFPRAAGDAADWDCDAYDKDPTDKLLVLEGPGSTTDPDQVRIAIPRRALCDLDSTNLEIVAYEGLFQPGKSDLQGKGKDGKDGKDRVNQLFSTLRSLAAEIEQRAYHRAEDPTAPDQKPVLRIFGRVDADCFAQPRDCENLQRDLVTHRARTVFETLDKKSLDNVKIEAQEDDFRGLAPWHAGLCRDKTGAEHDACTAPYRGILVELSLPGAYPCPSHHPAPAPPPAAPQGSSHPSQKPTPRPR